MTLEMYSLRLGAELRDRLGKAADERETDEAKVARMALDRGLIAMGHSTDGLVADGGTDRTVLQRLCMELQKWALAFTVFFMTVGVYTGLETRTFSFVTLVLVGVGMVGYGNADTIEDRLRGRIQQYFGAETA